MEPWWSLGGALGWPWGGSLVPSRWLCGGLGVALRWLCTPESMPSICLVYGLGVASGGFEMNSPQHPKWNQPRKGASDAARHSRSRRQNSLNAEMQRFAAPQSRNGTGQADRKMGDRKMKTNPIFLSSIFLSVCLPVRPPSSSRFSRSWRDLTCPAVALAKADPTRLACCPTALSFSLGGETSIHHSSFILHHFRHSRFAPESRCFSRLAWPLGRCRLTTVLAMGQNRQKTGKTYLLTPSTSSGRMGPE